MCLCWGTCHSASAQPTPALARAEPGPGTSGSPRTCPLLPTPAASLSGLRRCAPLGLNEVSLPVLALRTLGSDLGGSGSGWVPGYLSREAGDWTALMANFGEMATVGAAVKEDCDFGKARTATTVGI